MSEKQKKRNNFLVQGSILAIASIISRIIGFAYRIPMNRTLQETGGTYYNIAFYIYNLVLIISCFSIPTAVSKMVSTYRGKKQRYMIYQILKGSLLFALIVGTISGCFVYFGADFLAGTAFDQPYAAYALRVLAPVLLIVAIVGVIRGFFQGMGTMLPSAISQIVEQIINAVVSVVACRMLNERGLKYGAVVGDKENWRAAYAASGGTLGTFAGAAAALLFLCFLMMIYLKSFRKKMQNELRHESKEKESFRYIMYMLVMTILPILLSTAVYNVSDVIDLFLFAQINRFQGGSGRHYNIVVNGYGSEYRLMINVPIAVASALAASSIPAVTAAFQRGERETVSKQINGVMRLAMVVAFPCAVGLAVLARPIFSWLFPTMSKSLDSACIMMYIGSIAVVFYSVSTISNAILQGVDRMKAPVKNAAISLGIHVVLLVVMQGLLHWDIYAVVVSNALFSLIICVLNGIDLYRAINYRQEVMKTFLIPALSSGIMGLATWFVYQGMYKATAKLSISTIVSMLVAVLVYVVTILLLKGVDEEDILKFPMGGRLVRLFKKLHLL